MLQRINISIDITAKSPLGQLKSGLNQAIH